MSFSHVAFSATTQSRYNCSSMKDLSWFTSREGSYILRGTTEVFIDSEDTAKKLFELQSNNYTFEAPLRIHRKEIEYCESCSS